MKKRYKLTQSELVDAAVKLAIDACVPLGIQMFWGSVYTRDALCTSSIHLVRKVVCIITCHLYRWRCRVALSTNTRIDWKKLHPCAILIPAFSWFFYSTDRISFENAGLTSLVSLNVSNSRITSDGLQHLKPLKNLRSLYLEYCGVTASEIKKLQATTLPNLVRYRPNE